MIRFVAWMLLLSTIAGGARAAGDCRAELGAERSAILVEQCLRASPATHPPCNAANDCATIRDEINRGCGMLKEADRPAFCKPYAAGAAFVPRALARIRPGFQCAKATTPVETTICYDDDLADADRRMTAQFAASVKAGGDLAALRQDQRSFVQEREHCADGEPGHPDAERRRIATACVYDLTVGRLDELTGKGDGVWQAFSEGDPPERTCSVRFGRDGSDAVTLDYRTGNAAPAFRFEEVVIRERPILEATDKAGFDIDGTAFVGTVTVPSDPDDSPAIAPAQPAALVGALPAGRMVRVTRNGKVIFRAPLASFAAADAQARHDCGLPKRPSGS